MFLEDSRRVCENVDVDVFFPDEKNVMEQRSVIRDYCNVCPVREDCLEYALENNEIYGIWGGTTEIERKRLKKHRQAA